MNEILRPQDYKDPADIPRRLTIDDGGFKIEIKRSDTELCMIEEMVVNGHPVFFFDIATVKDLEPSKAPACGCGNRQVVAKRPTSDILKELEMDEEEYYRLTDVLKKYLGIGYCKRCR